jgi:hypothetical protein
LVVCGKHKLANCWQSSLPAKEGRNRDIRAALPFLVAEGKSNEGA